MWGETAVAGAAQVRIRGRGRSRFTSVVLASVGMGEGGNQGPHQAIKTEVLAIGDRTLREEQIMCSRQPV